MCIKSFSHKGNCLDIITRKGLYLINMTNTLIKIVKITGTGNRLHINPRCFSHMIISILEPCFEFGTRFCPNCSFGHTEHNRRFRIDCDDVSDRMPQNEGDRQFNSVSRMCEASEHSSGVCREGVEDLSFAVFSHKQSIQPSHSVHYIQYLIAISVDHIALRLL